MAQHSKVPHLPNTYLCIQQDAILCLGVPRRAEQASCRADWGPGIDTWMGSGDIRIQMSGGTSSYRSEDTGLSVNDQIVNTDDLCHIPFSTSILPSNLTLLEKCQNHS